MKKADDFRKAFGPATPGFESVVKKTIRELRAQETKTVVKEWRRWRRPVFAMAMVLVLFIGFVAVNGTINPFNRRDRIRSEEENLYTAQPITTVLSMGAGQEGDTTVVATEVLTAKMIEHSFWGFMRSWAENDIDTMLSLSTDEWKTNNPDPAKAMEELRASGKPRGYEITDISSGQGDQAYRANVVVQWEAEDGSYTWKRHEIAVRQEKYNGYTVYRFDPDGFRIGESAEAVPEKDMVLLTKEGIIRTCIGSHYSGISYDDLMPLNLSVEKQGIRVDIVSGCVKGKEACFLIRVQDVDGKYAGFSLEASPIWNEDYSSQGGTVLYFDKEANEYTQLIRVGLSDLVPTEGGSVVAGFDMIRVENSSNSIDLLPLLKEHRRTENGVTLPKLEKNYRGTEVPEDLRVLDYNNPLDIPLFKDVCLAGIGWVNSQLHVQIHNTGRVFIDLKNGRASAGGAGVSCSVNGKSNGNAYNDYSPLNWDGDGDGWSEWSEYVFNCQPQDVAQMKLEASVWVTEKILEDDWTFEIPMDPIRVPADSETAREAENEPGVEYDDYLRRFMYEWAQENWDTMWNYVEAGWKEQITASIREELKEKLSFAKPLSYQVNSVSATEDSNIRKLTITILADQGNGEEPQYQRCEMDLRRAKHGQTPDPLSFVILGPAENDPSVKTYDLSKETIFNRNLESFEKPKELIPVSGVSCEKDGIRAELISGFITSHEVWYVYSVEDTEKQFDDYSWNVDYLEDSIGYFNSFQEGELYHDPEKHQVIRMGHYGYSGTADLTDRTATLTLHTVRIGGQVKPGQWTLEFPLSAICPNVKEAESVTE